MAQTRGERRHNEFIYDVTNEHDDDHKDGSVENIQLGFLVSLLVYLSFFKIINSGKMRRSRASTWLAHPRLC